MGGVLFLQPVIDKCHANLFTSKVALAYLISRKVSVDDMKKYKIGYIGKVFSNIKDECADSNLFNKWLGPKGQYIGNRIVFPIYDELGNIKGIETRGLDKTILSNIRSEYINTTKEGIQQLPDSTIRYKKFYLTKSKHTACFFGMPSALKSIWDTKYVFLTEGIFDCLSLMKIYPNCVSSMTANINEYQINWLKRYTNKLIFLFDTDKKGKDSVGKLKEKYEKDFLIYSVGLKGDDVNEVEIKSGIGDLKKMVEYKMNMMF